MKKKTISFFLLASVLFVQAYGQKKKHAEAKISADADGKYKISLYNQVMVVDSKEGARITSFTANKKEIIGPGGSTFWTSPQEAWGWPPIKEHHDNAYEAKVTGNKLELTGKPDAKLNISIKKTFTGNPSDSSFTVSYTYKNEGTAEVKVAGWENTRTHKTSINFYPKGLKDLPQSPTFGELGVKNEDGIVWFAYAPERIKGSHMAKLYADGQEGWIANANDGLLLIKKFKDLSLEEQAPGEGEIEIFADKDNPFIEMEQQGPYKTLAPGESATWEVKWILRALPANIKAEEGNKKLTALVRKIVKK